jgi:predicted AAA+ superfamily ATPase
VNAKKLFEGNLDIKTILFQLSTYNTNIPIIEGKTLIFFDEAQKCPQVLTALKSFAIDNRFDVIVSGSMLGIIMHEVSSFPVGYVEKLHMRPMSFKEFLWANNYSEEMIEGFKEYFDKELPVPSLIHDKLNELFLHYVVVGGMPEAVKAYVDTSNLYNVLEAQRRILDDYKDDIAKYSTKMMKEKVRECFESIPDQLAKDNKKFQYKIIRQGGTARYYGNSLAWILDSGLGIKVNRLKTFDIPLRAYRDPNAFKFYLNDTGLLLAFYKENLSNEIINGNLGIFKGGVFENIVAQGLTDNELDIYYYQKADNLEIDFITYLNDKIIPIEVKSGKNTKAVSIKNIVEKEKLEYGIILSMNNLNCSNSKIKFLPLYMIMFLKNN